MPNAPQLDVGHQCVKIADSIVTKHVSTDHRLCNDLKPLASPIKLCSRVRHFLFFFLLTNRNIYVLWRRKFPWIWLIACCNFLGINSFSWRWDGRKDFCALKYNELLNKRRNKRRKKMSHDLLMPFYRNKINKNRKKNERKLMRSNCIFIWLHAYKWARDRVVRTSAFWLGGPGFKSRYGWFAGEATYW